MDTFEIMTPIGVPDIINQIDGYISKKEAYRRGNIPPDRMIIPMEAGNGQSTIVEYFEDVFEKYHIRKSGGMDSSLEFTVPETMDQIKLIFSCIKSSATYTNYYRGIIAFDISALCKYVNGAQTTFFLNEVKEVCKEAVLIFFIPEIHHQNNNINSMIRRIEETFEPVSYLNFEPYSTETLLNIAERVIEDSGVKLIDRDGYREWMSEEIYMQGITSAKAVANLAKRTLVYADYSGFTPVLHFKEMFLIKNNQKVV